MTVIPSTLALANIPDGSQIVAGDHRNNYSALQTFANALLGILDDGVVGQVLTGTSSTLAWAYPPGYRLDYVQITGNVSVTATSSATANTVVTGTSQAYDGTDIWVEFYAPGFTTGTNTARLVLYDGSTELGDLSNCNLGSGLRAGAVRPKVKVTPSAGTHQYIVKAYVDGGTGTVLAGAGTIGVESSAYILVTKA